MAGADRTPARIGPAAAGPASAKPKRTKVRATKTGYYNEQRYRAGDVFVFAGDKLASWMEPVPVSTPEKVTTGQEVVTAENDQVRKDRAAERVDDEVI